MIEVRIEQKAITHGQRLLQGNPPEVYPRMCSCPFFYATRKAVRQQVGVDEVIMVGADSVQLRNCLSIPLSPEAMEWVEQSDRHYQGLDPNPPKPATFKLLYPL
jgi:hypothetical protein